MGQTKFLRAFYYYELASMYGNVPMRLKPGSEAVTQGNIEDPWKQILMDLRDAVALLPAAKSTDGHIDKYAAEAMLGRAWLFYSGFFGNGSTLADLTSTTYNPLTSVELPDGTTLSKEDVITAIDDCVANSGRKLVDKYQNLWAYTNRCTVEDYDYTKGRASSGLRMMLLRTQRLCSLSSSISSLPGVQQLVMPMAMHFTLVFVAVRLMATPSHSVRVGVLVL